MMSMLDFDFTNRREQSAVATKQQTAASGRASPRSPDACQPTANDADRFMRIVGQTTQIKCHRDLFQMLQGEEIQHFIPHQILISAWGDFGGSGLKLDVISAISGVRTGLLHRCIDGLLKSLYKRWLAHGRQPLLLDYTDVRVAHSACECALHKSLQGAWSLLVHGAIDARDCSDTLYLALNASSIVNGHSIERFRFLADPLISQIDVAFRRIAALKSPDLPTNQEFYARLEVLSTREQEILLWVSEGKTNNEIAKILAISSFTVKNHMQRIMKKLQATNRTEAVAMYREISVHPKSRNAL